MKLRVKRLTSTAKLPVRSSDGAVGYDLYADVAEPVELAFGVSQKISTGIAVEIPEGHYGRIAPRSGLASKHGLDVLAGVIDPDYRGEIIVILDKLEWSRPFEKTVINPGDRIAQLIIEKVSTPEVEEITALTSTTRGDGGFGSTGLS